MPQDTGRPGARTPRAMPSPMDMPPKARRPSGSFWRNTPEGFSPTIGISSEGAKAQTWAQGRKAGRAASATMNGAAAAAVAAAAAARAAAASAAATAKPRTDLGGVVLLNVTQNLDVVVLDKVDGHTLCATVAYSSVSLKNGIVCVSLFRTAAGARQFFVETVQPRKAEAGGEGGALAGRRAPPCSPSHPAAGAADATRRAPASWLPRRLTTPRPAHPAGAAQHQTDQQVRTRGEGRAPCGRSDQSGRCDGCRARESWAGRS